MPEPIAPPYILVVMGVSGVGKTTIGLRLAERLDLPFFDADDYHPPDNVEKMASGTPLTDIDRHPWLERLHLLAAELLAEGRSAVFACSALKASYRKALRGGLDRVRFVYLAASPAQVAARLTARSGHFMPPSLLESQYEALEEPTGAIRVDADASPEAVVDAIVARVRGTAPRGAASPLRENAGPSGGPAGA